MDVDTEVEERIQDVNVGDVIRSLGVVTSVRTDWPGRRKMQKYIRLAIRDKDGEIEEEHFWLRDMRLFENGRRILRKVHDGGSGDAQPEDETMDGGDWYCHAGAPDQVQDTLEDRSGDVYIPMEMHSLAEGDGNIDGSFFHPFGPLTRILEEPVVTVAEENQREVLNTG